MGASDPSRAIEHAAELDLFDDIVLTPGDLDALKAEMAWVFDTEQSARSVLARIGYPLSHVPVFGDDRIDLVVFDRTVDHWKAWAVAKVGITVWPIQ